MPEDLGPSATSALAAAYDNALGSVQSRAGDTYPLLRVLLARHLMAAALAGERHPDLLCERAVTYVAKWVETARSRKDGWQAATTTILVTRIELGEILLAEAQKAMPAHTSYPGHVTVYAVPKLRGLGPNWTIQGFTPWTDEIEKCREYLGAAERELKNSYRVV